jgi:glucose/arabinose dehydrogenase
MRYKFNNDGFTDEKVIIDGIPGAVYHDGGRIEFGPDGYLYITTGDAGNEDLAQDTSSLAGKILRLNDEGEVPDDNPFENELWSYGHRNPQGIAWDDKGQLWATEHGRSGLLSGFDEINLIEKGKNYGWPEIQGDETAQDMVPPVIHSGPDVTWAPAGLVYIDGTLLFTGLRGESVYEAEIQSDNSINSVKANFKGEFGRLRAIKLGDDGFLYISTSNRDGRGQPLIEDDRIIKTNPELWM